jgi:hypothetical protein
VLEELPPPREEAYDSLQFDLGVSSKRTIVTARVISQDIVDPIYGMQVAKRSLAHSFSRISVFFFCAATDWFLDSP